MIQYPHLQPSQLVQRLGGVEDSHACVTLRTNPELELKCEAAVQALGDQVIKPRPFHTLSRQSTNCSNCEQGATLGLDRVCGSSAPLMVDVSLFSLSVL